jgi:oligopeptide/dipeptide ABC transporter ATP-binding protein
VKAAADPLVVTERLVKEYVGDVQRVRAVDGVELAIAAGESFGLVGESGSGKSTLARLLLALERPTGGRVLFAGRDVTGASPRQLRRLRREMQIVFQDPVGSLNRRKTVQQIVSAPLVVHRVKPASARRARVLELLELVGLSARHAARYPGQLSGGQAQRVGIARALALEPRFVILDEAVSALDVSVRAQILNLINELQEKLGLTYLFISHDLAIVRYVATRVAVMYRGRIIELAERSELFGNPRHPYTFELLRSIPEPDPSAAEAPASPGAPRSDPFDDPSGGCRFRPRCPIGRSLARCAEIDPALARVDGEHQAACHFAATSPELLRDKWKAPAARERDRPPN